MIGALLTGAYHLPRRDLERGLLRGSRSSGAGGLAGGGAGAIGWFAALPDRARRRGVGATERGRLDNDHFGLHGNPCK